VISTFRARAGLPPAPILIAIAVAWMVTVLAQLSGRGVLLEHGHLAEGGLPLWAALGLFLVAWQLMIVAMMLPSSLPLIVLFTRAVASQPRPTVARASFLLGYVVVWTVFGVAALAGDLALHRLVHQWAWLADRPSIIAGGVLLLAGAFQFSDLKERCLRECRHPGIYLMQHYRRGIVEAFRLGRGHGLFCLGCCWALMLVGFAAGVANLAWMVVLTLLMVFEKTGRGGDRASGPIGVGLLALGGLVFIDPGWVPPLLGAH